MAQILSQDEIDALLTGLDEVTEEKKTSVHAAEGEVLPYDFTSTAITSHIKLPGLDVIHDQFNRGLRSTLSSTLRIVVDSTVVPTEVISFKEFLRRVPVPCNIHILKMEPLRGHALLLVDSRLVFGIVEIFLGSSKIGQARVEGREFTSIEQRLIRKVVNAILLDLQKAWKHIAALDIHYVRSEINPQFAKIAQNDETVIVSKFQLDMDEITGAITLCVPLTMLQPLKAKLQSTYQMEAEEDPVWKKLFLQNLAQIELDVVVPLGNAVLTTSELMDLAIGDVIMLDTDLDTLLPVLFQDCPKFLGHPGVVKGQMAVEIKKEYENV